MRLPSRDELARAVFTPSLAALAFLCGMLVHDLGWFPSSLLDRAVRQARALSQSRTPAYVYPRVHDRAGARIHAPGQMQPGLTLVETHLRGEEEWLPGLQLLDAEGRVLHEWRIDPRTAFPDAPHDDADLMHQAHPHGSHLFADGDVLVNIEYVGTLRLDACGEVLWRIPGTHHSIARADDGTFWIPDRRPLQGKGVPAPSGFPGSSGSILHPVLLRVSPEGRVLDRIDLLAALYGNDLERYFAKYEALDGHPDPVHLNDVEPLSAAIAGEFPLLEAGDLLISSRTLDLVLVLDPDTREVEWHASEPFIMQHDPDFLADGWIGVFDNNRDGSRRGHRLGGSRIVLVKPGSDSTKVVFPTSESEPFHTKVGGKWQRLANGNMLLTESTAGRAVEVAPDGRTVWEWVAPPYGSSTVAGLWSARRYDLTPQQVAAWPCSPGDSIEGRENKP